MNPSVFPVHHPRRQHPFMGQALLERCNVAPLGNGDENARPYWKSTFCTPRDEQGSAGWFWACRGWRRPGHALGGKYGDGAGGGGIWRSGPRLALAAWAGARQSATAMSAGTVTLGRCPTLTALAAAGRTWASCGSWPWCACWGARTGLLKPGHRTVAPPAGCAGPLVNSC